MTRPVEVERKQPVPEPLSHVRTVTLRHVQTTYYPSGAWVRVVAFVPSRGEAEVWNRGAA